MACTPDVSKPLALQGEWVNIYVGSCEGSACEYTVTESWKHASDEVSTETVSDALSIGLNAGFTMEIPEGPKISGGGGIKPTTSESAMRTIMSTVSNNSAVSRHVKINPIKTKDPDNNTVALWQWQVTAPLPTECGGNVVINTPYWATTTSLAAEPCCVPGFMCDDGINDAHQSCTEAAGCISNNKSCSSVCAEAMPRSDCFNAKYHDARPK